METRQPSHSDWWARMIGLCGLLAGLGAYGQSYFSGQATAARNELREDFRLALARQSEQFNASWNKQLTEAMTRFEEDAGTALEQERKNRLAREATFRQTVQQLAVQRDELAALVEKRYEDWQSELAAPQLRVAEGVLKPLSDNDASAVTIKNDGSHEARIHKVTYQPEAEFRSVQTLTMATGLDAGNRIRVEFQAEHNTSSQAGRHGLYVRGLDDPPVVPGHGYAALQIVIRNSEHVGWGFEGTLTIDYDDGRSLVVPRAKAFFAPTTVDELRSDG